MARILGVNLRDTDRIEYALTNIYGVGFSRSAGILKQASISVHKKVKDLSEEELKKLSTLLEEQFKVEGPLKEEVTNNIRRLRDIAAYRGVRHARGLPSKGQRTRSNARTKRGKRKTVGALRKEDMLKMQQSK